MLKYKSEVDEEQIPSGITIGFALCARMIPNEQFLTNCRGENNSTNHLSSFFFIYFCQKLQSHCPAQCWWHSVDCHG